MVRTGIKRRLDASGNGPDWPLGPSPSLRPPLFISGNSAQRTCAESRVAFQGGGSRTGEEEEGDWGFQNQSESSGSSGTMMPR